MASIVYGRKNNKGEKMTTHLVRNKGILGLNAELEDKTVVYRHWTIPKGMKKTREPFLNSEAIDRLLRSDGVGNEVGIPIKKYRYATGCEAVAACLNMATSDQSTIIDTRLRKLETGYLKTFAANTKMLNRVYWEFLSNRDPFGVHCCFKYLKWLLCFYLCLQISLSQDTVVLERAFASYPIEAGYMENVEWDNTSKSEQLEIIHERSDLERFGKDWLVYNFSEQDPRFANQNILSPEAIYFGTVLYLI